MKNLILKLMSFSVSAVLVVSSCVCATEYPVFFGDGMVNYEKSLSEETAGKGVTISVTDVDKIWNDAEWENIDTDAFVYADNKTVDENGDIVVDFMVENSGVYSVILGVDDETENIYDEIEVIIKSQAESAIERLKTVSQGEELETVLKECRNELGLTSDNFDSVLKDLVNVIYNSKGTLDSNTENNILLLKKALKVAEFNCGMINFIAGNEEIIGLQGSEYEKWYKDSFDTEIVRRLTKKSFKTVNDFEKALKEAVLLERIENPSGNGDIVNIISENHSEMNLSHSSVSLNVAGKLAEGSYSNYKVLNDKITELKNAPSGGGGGGSSGGGGGGSFGKGSSGVGVLEVEDIKTETPDKKPTSRFADMNGYEWAENAVETLATKGIVNGKGNGKFDPGANVTREEFAKMIVSLFNFNVVSPDFKFTDVNKDSWYYEYVRRAHGCRVINGISDTVFGSGQNILRQDAVVMMYNALKYIKRAENGDVVKNFNDESSVSDYAMEAVDVLSSCGIIKGDNTGNLSPKADITRAEAAVIIYNVMKKYDL